MASINARSLLSGFTLGLAPTLTPLQDQQGQYAGMQVDNSSFSPRISIYTGDKDKPFFRGERSFAFGVTALEPEDGVHKGLISKKDFFESFYAGVKMTDVLAAFRGTAAALLDDTVDGQQTSGQFQLDYRMERIDAVLKGHEFVSNYVQVDFGVYENGGKVKLYTIALRYVPDPTLEPLKQRIAEARKRLDTAEKEMKKLNEAMKELDVSDTNYDLEVAGISQKINQQVNAYNEAAKALGSAESIVYFPLSQLWAETGIKEATVGLMVGVYSELKKSSYLLADYDLSQLAAVDVDAMLYQYAHMEAKPE